MFFFDKIPKSRVKNVFKICLIYSPLHRRLSRSTHLVIQLKMPVNSIIWWQLKNSLLSQFLKIEFGIFLQESITTTITQMPVRITMEVWFHYQCQNQKQNVVARFHFVKAMIHVKSCCDAVPHLMWRR